MAIPQMKKKKVEMVETEMFRMVPKAAQQKFEKEAEYLIDKLKVNPFLFQRKYKYYREANLKRFPYFIVYEIIDNTIIIHSFFHAHRNPARKLKSRS